MLEVKEMMRKYLEYFPEDGKNLDLLEKQIQREENVFDRTNGTGHIVANALIFYRGKVLVVFHNFLKRYLQPGGHIEKNDLSIVEGAFREAREETGINDLVLCSWHKETHIPIFIETHLIPENSKKREKQHYHYDCMYAFKTNTKDVRLQTCEVSDFLWMDMKTLIEKDSDSFLSKSLQRSNELKFLEV